MDALRAHVRGGRLLLDEPTDLPEGAEVELVAVGGDDMDADERARLLATIDESADDSERGEEVDGFELVNRLRALHAGTGR